MSTFNVAIGASSDDCAESETGTTVTGGSQLIIDSRGAFAGFRFLAITIPQGATINSATLTLTYTGSASADPITMSLYGVDADDTDTWSSTNEPSGQTYTTAETGWYWEGTFSPNALYGTKELDATSIVQEIVDRGGWSSGNDMSFVLKRLFDVTTGNLKINSWDSSYPEAELDIDYEGGTNMQINISDVWKEISAMQINIGDVWKPIASAKINIGDVWKTIF